MTTIWNERGGWMKPKFRAWDKSNKKMCDVKALSAFNGGELTIDDADQICGKETRTAKLSGIYIRTAT